MRRTLSGIDIALGEAVNRIRPIWESCPDPRPDIAGEAWHALEAELDRACGSGERDLALLAIRRWEDRTLDVLQRCSA